MRKHIHLTLDDEERILAVGMRIRHLLDRSEVEAVGRRELFIVDSDGFERGIDGALADGMILKRKRTL